jgi:hypothetical protein
MITRTLVEACLRNFSDASLAVCLWFAVMGCLQTGHRVIFTSVDQCLMMNDLVKRLKHADALAPVEKK